MCSSPRTGKPLQALTRHNVRVCKFSYCIVYFFVNKFYMYKWVNVTKDHVGKGGVTTLTNRWDNRKAPAEGKGSMMREGLGVLKTIQGHKGNVHKLIK